MVATPLSNGSCTARRLVCDITTVANADRRINAALTIGPLDRFGFAEYVLGKRSTFLGRLLTSRAPLNLLALIRAAETRHAAGFEKRRIQGLLQISVDLLI
jgi:hypothetical protein